MRTRHGFVSNSSVTSFIIGIKRVAEVCPSCGRGGEDLLKILDRHNHEETTMEWSDVDAHIAQLRANIKHCRWQGWVDEANAYQQTVDMLVEAQQRDFLQIIGVDISHHDPVMDKTLDDMKRSGDITILQGDE